MHTTRRNFKSEDGVRRARCLPVPGFPNLLITCCRSWRGRQKLVRRVRVPFGKQQERVGIVISASDHSEFAAR